MISDFHIPGTFSRVYLCQQKTEKSNQQKYQALKILPINEVIRHKQVQHVNSEREILQVHLSKLNVTLNLVFVYSEDKESICYFRC